MKNQGHCWGLLLIQGVQIQKAPHGLDKFTGGIFNVQQLRRGASKLLVQ